MGQLIAITTCTRRPALTTNQQSPPPLPATIPNSPPTACAKNSSMASASRATAVRTLTINPKSKPARNSRTIISARTGKGAISATTSKYAWTSWRRNAKGGSIALIGMYIKAVLISTWGSACEAISASRSILWGSYAGITCTGTARKGVNALTTTPKSSLKTISNIRRFCMRSFRSPPLKWLSAEAAKSSGTK